MGKLSVIELRKLNDEERKRVLKKEGDESFPNPKHKEWMDIFELM